MRNSATAQSQRFRYQQAAGQPLSIKVSSFIVMVTLLCTLFVLSGCKSKTKVTGNYIDLTKEVIQVQPDKSLMHIPVTVPPPRKNKSWKNSNSSLAGVPENILVKLKPAQIKSYNLHHTNTPGSNRTPVIYGDMLYTLDDKGTVYAYDRLKLPNIVWKKNLSPAAAHEFLGGGIATDGAHLAVTYGNKELILLDSNSGDEIWRHNLSNVSSIAPVIYKKHVLALTVDNKLYCIGLEGGSLNWVHEEIGEEFGMMGAASPTGTQDMVIAPYLSGQLANLDIATGNVNWTLALQNETQTFLNDISVTPVIVDNTVYTANYGGTLSATDINTGKAEWTHRNGGGNNSIWIAGDFIYSINKDAQLLAIYKDTGAVKWIYNLPQDKDASIKFSGPTMINSELYIASSFGQVFVINPKTGKKVNEIKIAKHPYSLPVAVNDYIYMLTSSGTLLVIG